MSVDDDEYTDVPTMDPEEAFRRNKNDWYTRSVHYWKRQDHDDSGMTGGYSKSDDYDIEQTREVMEMLQNQENLPNGSVADCGGGVGRVALAVLKDMFSHITIVDPVQEFLDIAEFRLKGKVNSLSTVCTGIQNWEADRKYDCYWCQWPIMYLTDTDAVRFLVMCKRHLSQNGMIVIKENIASLDQTLPRDQARYFECDNSVCRVYSHYMDLFSRAGLRVAKYIVQRNWPPELLPMVFFVLIP